MNPLILHESSRGIDAYNAESSLLRKRMLFFCGDVSAESCNILLQNLIHLDQDRPGEEITLIINSPGGEVQSGLAVYDTMQLLRSPVRTICAGVAASMGSIMFLGGRKREVLPNSKILIHDPLLKGSAGIKRALELDKEASELMEMRTILAEIISGKCGKSLEDVLEKTKEDSFMDASQAIEFGLATGICKKII